MGNQPLGSRLGLLLTGFLPPTDCVGRRQPWGGETTFHPKAASFDSPTLKQGPVVVPIQHVLDHAGGSPVIPA